MTDDSHQPTASPPSRSPTPTAIPTASPRSLGQSFVDYGFAIVRDHGIPQDLIDRAEAKAKAFFALPEEVKRDYLIAGGGGARGYTPFGIETAKGATASRPQGILARRARACRGPPLPRRDGATMSGRTKSPASRRPSSSCTTRSTRPGLKILRAIARFLKVDEDYFTDTVRDGNSVMRLLHYPPQSTSRPATTSAPARMRTSTPSPCCSAPRKRGWSCKTKDGRWLPVSPKPGELVVNIGDMLQRLTNGVLALDHPPRGQPGARPGAAMRATRCPSSSTSAPIS